MALALRMTSALRRPHVEWTLVAALGAYILIATRDWNVPEPGAVPFGPLWGGFTVAAIAVWVAVRRAVGPVDALALGALVAMVLTDASYLATQGLRDLHLYLRAGERFATGEAVYLQALVTERPDDLANYPFLYPPPTLPLFAVLAALPRLLVDVAWVALSVCAALATFRLFGLPWRWAMLLLLWPPVFQGIQVGNVSVPLAVLFAIAPWVGAGLVVQGVFKLYSGVAAIWLLRQRRLGAVAVGIAILAVWALATLPITGLERWAEWWRGLELFRASQPLLPDSLYGFGLPRYVPAVLALAAAGLIVIAAVRTRGTLGLGRLGLATGVAAPSLYAHGLIVGLPAFLELRAFALWVALALTSVAPGIAWWLAIALVVVAWFVPALRQETGERRWHPLGEARQAWPAVREPRTP